jgi:hypothetical protein
LGFFFPVTLLYDTWFTIYCKKGFKIYCQIYYCLKFTNEISFFFLKIQLMFSFSFWEGCYLYVHATYFNL